MRLEAVRSSPRVDFTSSIRSFLSENAFEHQRFATFHGRRLLVVRTPSSSLALHLLATPRARDEVLPAVVSSELSDAYAARSADPRRARRGRSRRMALVHLWEDQWLEHRAIVASRLLSMLCLLYTSPSPRDS